MAQESIHPQETESVPDMSEADSVEAVKAKRAAILKELLADNARSVRQMEAYRKEVKH